LECNKAVNKKQYKINTKGKATVLNTKTKTQLSDVLYTKKWSENNTEREIKF
jgi:hypothetical protein